MQPNLRTPAHRSGTALIMVVAMVMMTAAIAMALTNSSVVRFKDSVDRQTSLTLMTSAEAALNLGYAWCSANGAALNAMPDPSVGGATTVTPVVLRWPDNTVASTINGMSIYADCTRLSTNTFRLRVQSTIGEASVANPRGNPEKFRRKMIEVAISRTPFTVPAFGLYSWFPYQFKGSGSATVMDSSPGSDTAAEAAYKSQAHIPGLQGTTGPVVLASGDVLTVAKAGAVSGATINGTAVGVQYGTVAMTVPTLPYNPPIAGSGAPLTANVTLAAGNTYRYTGWTGGTVTVSGVGSAYLYIDGDIDYGNIGVNATTTAKLQVRQGTSGTADYLASKLNGNATLADPANPGNFILVSAAAGNLTLNGNAKIGMVLIAPNLNLKIRGNLTLNGAVMVHAMDTDPAPGSVGMVTGNPSFAYDTQLAGLQLTDYSSLATAAWRTDSLGFAAHTMNDAATYPNAYVNNAR